MAEDLVVLSRNIAGDRASDAERRSPTTDALHLNLTHGLCRRPLRRFRSAIRGGWSAAVVAHTSASRLRK